MENDVKERVLKTLADVLNCKQESIQLDATLDEGLKMDSLQRMTLFILLEDEFERTIAPEQVSDIRTVQEIIEFIDTSLKKSSAA